MVLLSQLEIGYSTISIEKDKIQLAMRSTMDQELFKALSNRTRTKPHEIYNKISSHITFLQDQIMQFNKVENDIPQWLREQTNKMGGEPRRHTLKMMTQPKYQNLLINCELSQGDRNSLKNSKLMRKGSTKIGKDMKNSSFGSTSKSFNPSYGMRSKQQSSTKLFSKIGTQKDIQSTMVQSASKLKAEGFTLSGVQNNNLPKKQMNISMTESILLAVHQTNRENVRSKLKSNYTVPISLREQIQRKQKLLSEEWGKTQRYHNKIGNWIGVRDMQKIEKTHLFNSRVNEVIKKIKRSRPASSQNSEVQSRNIRVHSQQI